MKHIRSRLLLTTILLLLNYTNFFGQNRTATSPNPNKSKKLAKIDDLKNILLHHLKSFQENDIAVLLNDYTSKSVLITQDSTYIGKDEIKNFFTTLMVFFPKNRSYIFLDKMSIKDNLIYITWHAKTPSLEVIFGTDTFVIKDGKIYQQTFAGELKYTK